MQNLNVYKKDYIDFGCQTASSSQNGHVLPQMSFSQFSPKILLFSKNVLNNGYIKFLPKKPHFPKKWSNALPDSFLQFPQKMLLFPKKLFNIKICSF